MKSLNNPWTQLSQSEPFALDADISNLINYNNRLSLDSPFRYELCKVLPEPFIGRPDLASVVILQLNPGYDAIFDPESHSDHSFRLLLRENLAHKSTQYPFYYFHPEYTDHPGSRWWRNKARHLIELIPIDVLSKKLAVIEWFPYKSHRFKDGCLVPSQSYSFALVEEAIMRESVIVVSRSFQRWIKSVPGLANYKYLLTLSSTQNISLSPNNMMIRGVKDNQAWRMLVEALSSC